MMHPAPYLVATTPTGRTVHYRFDPETGGYCRSVFGRSYGPFSIEDLREMHASVEVL